MINQVDLIAVSGKHPVELAVVPKLCLFVAGLIYLYHIVQVQQIWNNGICGDGLGVAAVIGHGETTVLQLGEKAAVIVVIVIL